MSTEQPLWINSTPDLIRSQEAEENTRMERKSRGQLSWDDTALYRTSETPEPTRD